MDCVARKTTRRWSRGHLNCMKGSHERVAFEFFEKAKATLTNQA
jgi:hypothetical protein